MSLFFQYQYISGIFRNFCCIWMPVLCTFSWLPDTKKDFWGTPYCPSGNVQGVYLFTWKPGEFFSSPGCLESKQCQGGEVGQSPLPAAGIRWCDPPSKEALNYDYLFLSFKVSNCQLWLLFPQMSHIQKLPGDEIVSQLQAVNILKFSCKCPDLH